MAKEDNASGAMQREALEQKLHCLFDDLKLSNLLCLSNFNSKKDSLNRFYFTFCSKNVLASMIIPSMKRYSRSGAWRDFKGD